MEGGAERRVLQFGGDADLPEEVHAAEVSAAEEEKDRLEEPKGRIVANGRHESADAEHQAGVEGRVGEPHPPEEGASVLRAEEVVDDRVPARHMERSGEAVELAGRQEADESRVSCPGRRGHEGEGEEGGRAVEGDGAAEAETVADVAEEEAEEDHRHGREAGGEHFRRVVAAKHGDVDDDEGAGVERHLGDAPTEGRIDGEAA